MSQKNYPQLALTARRKVLEMIHRGQTSHIASNFSVIDIATVLYENLQEGDVVVWSKGWAAASIYYFLVKNGQLNSEALDKFPNDPYFGLAEVGVPGVEVSGGSMGHGLPVAVGMALGKKRAGEKGKVYVIMSDGECNEGTTWESAAVAAHHQLDNLIVFVDKNNWQAMGTTDEVLNIVPERSFRGFNWGAIVIDGHNFKEIEKAMEMTNSLFMPTAIVCETIKGKGVSFMENHLLYHYKNITPEDYELALKELQ